MKYIMPSSEQLWLGSDNAKTPRYELAIPQIIHCMVDEKCTIRECAKAVNLSPAMVHRTIHTTIRMHSPIAYSLIKKVLAYNLEFKRKPKEFW